MTTSLLTAWAIGHENMLREWTFPFWVLVTVLLTVTSALALTPPTFLAMVYGYFLGWVALPLLFMLNLGAICIVYFLARFLNPGKTRNYLLAVYPKVGILLKRFRAQELRLIFFAKLSPILPFAVTNLFFAIAGARLKQVLAGGTLGMIPRTILAVWVGYEAQDIRYLLEHPNEGLGSKVLLILLISASTVGMGYFFRSRNAVGN
ncbi:hypothetical protein DYBT9275_04479 [Dyadobacter sp. CECT 9275]|uniref:TVP38/TMEM64 family membrane protein n=1 Tax=Dyadobacter helix TaxID=2822344 RepID=A0A916JGS4_9BACT|nr:VTT domain-containing protein [Dyadobacter sp. CECT 9275]CAG5009362.1 hypothetical protein DYBT9275_04479 [Dyadobacter sp. CECT 9275]